MLAELQPVSNPSPSSTASLLSFLRVHFPINELTSQQWSILEDVADLSKKPPISQIITFRLCNRVESCTENEVYFIVTRYLEIHPMSRQILLKKTVKNIPVVYPLEMYLQHYRPVRKL